MFTSPLALILPSTCNFSVGDVVPIPTLPPVVIVNLSPFNPFSKIVKSAFTPFVVVLNPYPLLG